MKKLLYLLVFSLSFLPVFAQIQDPVKWTYSVKELNETESELVFTAQLDEGWHLYSQYTDPNGPIAIYFEFAPTKSYKLIGKVQEPKPHEEFDEDFKCTVRSFSGRVVFRQKIERLSDKDFNVTGTFGYQLCNSGSCIAPDDRDFSFTVKGAEGNNAVAADAQEPAADTATAVVEPLPTDTAAVAGDAQADETNQPEEKEKKQSLFVIFLLAILGGILTMFTPCVFPMIPMTVNFFMNSTASKRAALRRGSSDSASSFSLPF